MNVFLHGLDSSSQGTKGRYFSERFPEMLTPDFDGTLAERMATMHDILAGKRDLTLVGSSFGGLMATIFAMQAPDRVKRLILLAPALNFAEFDTYPFREIDTSTLLVVGKQDDVTPPSLVIPKAKKIFTTLDVQEPEDDHLLRTAFHEQDWVALLSGS